MQKFGVVLIGFENLTQERCGLCPKLRVRSEYLSEHSILRSFNEKPLIAIVLSDVVHPYVLVLFECVPRSENVRALSRTKVWEFWQPALDELLRGVS